MGLLTDPTSGQGKLVELLLKYYDKLCKLMCLCGLVWFFALASPHVNASTYFSENALLPGLVRSMFPKNTGAPIFYNELIDEMKKYDNSIPYPWLLDKFKQLGLDTYTHNFTLNSPLSTKEKYTGQNVYGILRAPRAASTEALVLTVPYRPPSSVHPPTTASVALMLAFANFANKQMYWAKDVIFLITEHEQLGIQAWLEAYHGVTCGNENILDHGDLKGRAGAIQAAVNLEIHSPKISHIDIKIEGLNGQLPNLDLFNLASRMCLKEKLPHTFKSRQAKNYKDPVKQFQYLLRNMLAMAATQATGIPNGNHGLFHRFGIQALTLEGFERRRAIGEPNYVILGRVIEGIFRSLNNLIERFHQSFFFYILLSPERYISIGLYMPAICLFAGALFIKSCVKWFKLQEKESEGETENSQDGNQDNESIKFDQVIIFFLLAHFLGVIMMSLPQYITKIAEDYGYNVQTSIFYTLTGLSVVYLFLPYFIPFRSSERCMSAFSILATLELGTALICISMNNFPLAMFCGVLTAALAHRMNPMSNRYHALLLRVSWLFVHPLSVLIIVVLINTRFMFPREDLKEIFYRGMNASQQAVIYSIVDSMIYGNWMFSVMTSIFIPNWLCFWCVTFSKIEPKKIVTEEKKVN